MWGRHFTQLLHWERIRNNFVLAVYLHIRTRSPKPVGRPFTKLLHWERIRNNFVLAVYLHILSHRNLWGDPLPNFGGRIRNNFVLTIYLRIVGYRNLWGTLYPTLGGGGLENFCSCRLFVYGRLPKPVVWGPFTQLHGVGGGEED